MPEYNSIHEELKAKVAPALDETWVEYYNAIVRFIYAAQRYRNAAPMKREQLEEYDAAMKQYDAASQELEAAAARVSKHPSDAVR